MSHYEKIATFKLHENTLCYSSENDACNYNIPRKKGKCCRKIVFFTMKTFFFIHKTEEDIIFLVNF